MPSASPPGLTRRLFEDVVWNALDLGTRSTLEGRAEGPT
jgi:hypothetical protein